MVLSAEPNKITPATSNAAPTSTLMPEFESFRDSHTKRPRVMDATERNNSRACALTIRTRGGFNGMVVYLTFHRSIMVIYRGWYYYNHFYQNYLTYLLPAIHALFSPSLTTISGIGNHPRLPVMSTRTFLLNCSTGSSSSARKNILPLRALTDCLRFGVFRRA